jgi:predicted short-subunit dehydrogenase-like oxidoreductase (DUF2520 family)
MKNYAILGGGRLARHFSHYFQLSGIQHFCWTRDSRSDFNSFNTGDTEQRLRATVENADCILLLVSDSAIAGMLKLYPFLHEKKLVHCSGALSFPGVACAHPLMTFSAQMYSLETWQSVPFMLEEGSRFKDLFPALSNPNFHVPVDKKANYHACCVMAGNFAQVLWKGVTERFENELNLPASSLHPYLKQVLGNFMARPDSALTGPLSRNDQATIERNLQSLNGDPMQDLYRAFVQFHTLENQTLNTSHKEKTA